jgi:hypothetical protein
MSHRIAPLLALFGLLFAAGLAHADVWGWQDAEGKWHYSDRPREGAKLIRSGGSGGSGSRSGGSSAAAVPGAANDTSAQGAAIAERLESESAARAVAADLDKKRAEQCKEATERYDKMIATRRLFREKTAGEREYLTEAELSQARVDARKERDAACAAPRR